jgi:hypothetical protein
MLILNSLNVSVVDISSLLLAFYHYSDHGGQGNIKFS